MYKLFRESTRSSENGPVKDLSYLNRPLDRVLIVRTQRFTHHISQVDPSICVQLDTHPEHVATNPENAIVLKPWKGEPGDRGLIELIPFLECETFLTTRPFCTDNVGTAAIAIYKPPDVRAILKAYEGKSIPLEYAEKEAANKRAFVEEWKARGGGKVNNKHSLLYIRGLTFWQGLSSGGFTVSSLFSSSSEKVSTLTILPPPLLTFPAKLNLKKL